MIYFFRHIKANINNLFKKDKMIYKNEYISNGNYHLNNKQFNNCDTNKIDTQIIDTKINNINFSDNIKSTIENSSYLSDKNKLTIDNFSTLNNSETTGFNTVFKCNVDMLSDNNVLVHTFLNKMRESNSSPRMLGRIYDYLYDATNIQGPIEFIINDLKWKGGVISEVFLSSIPFLIPDINASGMILSESILTYQNIMDTHFDLLDAWIRDRITDCTSISECTPERWTKKFLGKLHNIENNLENFHQIIISDRSIVMKELIDRGIIKGQYGNSDIIKPILQEIGTKSGARYFPSHFNLDPDSYFNIPKNSIFSSGNHPPNVVSSPLNSPTSDSFVLPRSNSDSL